MRGAWLAWALIGCGDGPDEDGDGFGAQVDCDDGDRFVSPGALEACDGMDTDCDGVLPAAERDDDDDGWVACTLDPLDWRGPAEVVGGGDCDDRDAERFPGAVERCNGVADGCGEPAPFERDGDGDGFVACDAADWHGEAALEPGDCDDRAAGVFPGAIEACDGVDSDCDGTASPAEFDDDGDGYVDCTPPSDWLGVASAKFGDCDDTRPEVFPGAFEACDHLDTDCDGALSAAEVDADHDQVMACWPVGGASLRGNDCDDLRPEVLPGATEVCDGLDDDCDGSLDASEADADADGFIECVPLAGWSGGPLAGSGDCDDTQPTVFPGGLEAVDGVDSDCDGLLHPLERDDDGDGWFEAVPDDAWLGDPDHGGDCDDGDPAVSPGADEGCDGLDSSCDGLPGPLEADVDGDGFVACAYDAGTWAGSFTPVGGGDCDDADDATFPGGSEVCDAADNDCDALVDDADPDMDPSTLRTFWRDDDHDDWGVTGDSVQACRLPEGYAPIDLDCDDDTRSSHPFGAERCNGEDDDCDGLVDDEDDSLPWYLATAWYEDGDGDGVGTLDSVTWQCAAPGVGWVAEGGDCDDLDADVFPGAPELCNGRDDDCDRHPDLDAGAGSELGCDLCDAGPAMDPADLREELWNPCVLDPTSTSLCYTPPQVDTHEDGNRLSRVVVRTDATVLRPELYVHLPPSRGNHNTTFQRWVAQAGYRTIVLSTATDENLADTCGEGDTACQSGFLEEAQYGVDTSPYIDVGASDGVEDRLLTLLLHLDAVHPGEGWDQYVVGGEVAWDLVVLGAWSKAAPHALYAANQNAVSGLVLFSSPNQPITLAIDAPECRNFAVYHEDEVTTTVAEWESGFRSIGMDGATFDLDAAPYPWLGDPQIFTTRSWDYVSRDCTPHKALIYDECMDEPFLAPTYVDLFCHVGEVDPLSCP